MDSAQTCEALDRLAEMVVLAESTDMPTLAEMHTGFEGIHEWAVGADEPMAAEAAKAADENGLGELRRLIHTLKGDAGLLGLEDVALGQAAVLGLAGWRP